VARPPVERDDNLIEVTILMHARDRTTARPGEDKQTIPGEGQVRRADARVDRPEERPVLPEVSDSVLDRVADPVAAVRSDREGRRRDGLAVVAPIDPDLVVGGAGSEEGDLAPLDWRFA
jgi:hypothetical protein